MSSSNMVVLVLCVLLSVVESRVIKPREFFLPAEGVTVEVTIKNNSDKAHPLATLQIDVNELLKKVVIKDIITSKLNRFGKEPRDGDVPVVKNRFGILSGPCPIGRVMHGGICFPDDDE